VEEAVESEDEKEQAKQVARDKRCDLHKVPFRADLQRAGKRYAG
jgi:hypothetical protein